MTDVIVARLRQLQRVFGDPTSLAAMAADEIERLQNERDEAIKELCKALRSANGGSHGEQPKQG